MADFIPQGTGQQEVVQPEPTQFITPEQGTAMAQTGIQAQGQPQAPAGVPVGAGMQAHRKIRWKPLTKRLVKKSRLSTKTCSFG